MSVNVNACNFRYRTLAPGQTRAIRAAANSGVRARLLAAEYGVSVRTIYRTLARPVRVTSWLPA